MSGTKTLCVAVATFACVTAPAQAQHHGVHTASWHHGYSGGGQMRSLLRLSRVVPRGVRLGGWYAPPPFFMIPQGGFFPFGSMVPPPMMLPRTAVASSSAR